MSAAILIGALALVAAFVFEADVRVTRVLSLGQASVGYACEIDPDDPAAVSRRFANHVARVADAHDRGEIASRREVTIKIRRRRRHGR